jgi:hypothetical protein
MMEILAALLALLAAILPPLVAAWIRHSTVKRTEHDALTQLSLTELHAGTDQLRQQHPVQPQ